MFLDVDSVFFGVCAFFAVVIFILLDILTAELFYIKSIGTKLMVLL